MKHVLLDFRGSITNSSSSNSSINSSSSFEDFD